MGGSSTDYGGAHQPSMGGGIFPPVCTGSQNRENYFSNTYVLPSVNRTAGPITVIAVLFSTDLDFGAIAQTYYSSTGTTSLVF